MSKLLFLEILLFKGPYLFKAAIFFLPFQSTYILSTFSKHLYSFARATSSEDAVFQNSSFATANLVFTVTLSIYHLAISSTNTGVFRPLNTQGFTDSCTTQKTFPLNTMTKHFESKLLSQGSIELDNLMKNAKMFCFGGI